MNQLDGNSKVGDIVTQSPGAAKVFARHGIDFCCGGGRPLGDACGERGVAVDKVLAEIASADAPPDAPDWSALGLEQLCDEIERRYHVPQLEDLTRLEGLARKVASVHGERHPELRQLAELYIGLKEELDQHFMKEEQVLFPMIRQMGHAPPPPVEVMRREHVEAGDVLRKLREVSGGYALPADACNSYRALYEGLAAFERDLHEHIHVESNILFPRALPF
ncbi:MAG: iron-sulfur cluster repair di-iron protein [Polyangiaceae bacterium]|nr:iron-sulfur cluster repair di-iron protein [Polyangiaceae bacterium]